MARTKSRVKHIAFTAYPVTDMKRAREFYEGALGLEAGADYNGAWVEYYLDNGCFAITTMFPGTGSGLAFEVDDVDACYKELVAAGGHAHRDPFATPACRIAVVNDPDGNIVTLHKKNEGRA